MTSIGTIRTGDALRQGRDGSNNVKRQFIHGTAPLTRHGVLRTLPQYSNATAWHHAESRAGYIDELVQMRVKSKGDLYVHQDANWNVIALTDLARNVVERYVYTPYGEVIVQQEDSFGDRDGDDDVDSTDKGTVGVTCTGTVTAACRAFMVSANLRIE